MIEIKIDENTSGALNHGQMGFHAFSLHTRRGKILAVHLRSNGRDSSITISTHAFHQSH